MVFRHRFSTTSLSPYDVSSRLLILAACGGGGGGALSLRRNLEAIILTLGQGEPEFHCWQDDQLQVNIFGNDERVSSTASVSIAQTLSKLTTETSTSECASSVRTLQKLSVVDTFSSSKVINLIIGVQEKHRDHN